MQMEWEYGLARVRFLPLRQRCWQQRVDGADTSIIVNLGRSVLAKVGDHDCAN